MMQRPKKTSSPDQISLLPDSILHQILFYLPAKEATGTSVLSKSWNRVCKSLPILDFYNPEPQLHRLLPQESTAEARSKKLVRVVDHALQRLHMNKVIFRRFAFELILSGNEFVSEADLYRWIELATKNPIKDFLYIVTNKDKSSSYYELPRSVFAVNSFTSLNLSLCKIPEASIGDNLQFSCLKELGLKSVKIDELLLQKLLDNCPMLENFSFNHTGLPMKHLRVLKCPSLKSFHASSSILKIQIQSSNLEFFKYVGCKTIFELDKATWGNLKLLSIYCPGITNDSIEQVIRDSPLLEDLDFKTDLNRIKVSSPRLKRLRLKMDNFVEPLAIEIDTSNLRYCTVITYDIPSEFSITSSRLQETQLEMKMGLPVTGLDAPWFCELRRYLSKIQQGKLMTRLCIFYGQSQFQYEELSGIELPPLPSLGTLVLRDIGSFQNNSSLLEGLLWSCRPATLSLSTRRPYTKIFIEFLFEALMSREEDPRCCVGNEIKCWKHYLKDAKAFCGDSPVERFPTPPPDANIEFKLKW